MFRRAIAELVAILWLTFGDCGSAVLAARCADGANANINLGVGFVGAGVRADRVTHGFCDRTSLRTPFEPGGDDRPRCLPIVPVRRLADLSKPCARA